MIKLSTRQAAKKLSISHETLAHYVAVGKVPAPEIVRVGHRVVHMWTEADIEHVRQLLPKVANGRKMRYKKHSAVSTQQSTKAKSKTKSKKKK